MASLSRNAAILVGSTFLPTKSAGIKLSLSASLVTRALDWVDISSFRYGPAIIGIDQPTRPSGYETISAVRTGGTALLTCVQLGYATARMGG